MNNQVTIKQKVHQNNPIALFIRDIIIKNKKMLGIKIPVVIDFLDLSTTIGNITKPNGKYYYIPINKNETINATNPLKTKTKTDDYLMEYIVIAELGNSLYRKFQDDGVDIDKVAVYVDNIINKKVKAEVAFMNQDQRFKINQNEIKYIKSRIEKFKNDMGIKKQIIVEICDMLAVDGRKTMGSTYQTPVSIFFAIDYSFYKENKGNLIGNKALDMFIVHELSHTKNSKKFQSHGKEFKNIYKTYASQITKDTKLLNAWSNAHMKTGIMHDKADTKPKHALYIPKYHITNIYVDIDSGHANFTTNKGEYEQKRSIAQQNKKYGTKYVYINIPEREKITFSNKIQQISPKYITDNEYNIALNYIIYELLRKYGTSKQFSKLKTTDEYKTTMKNYKTAFKIIENKNKQHTGKPTQRKQKRQVTQTKFKI